MDLMLLSLAGFAAGLALFHHFDDDDEDDAAEPAQTSPPQSGTPQIPNPNLPQPQPNTFTGTNGPDVITPMTDPHAPPLESAVINGLRGHDLIELFANNSLINAGDGNDSIAFGGNGNKLAAGAGDDTAIFAGDDNLLYGGDGQDGFLGTGDGNILHGGAGDDTLLGVNLSKSALYGGNGNDVLGLRSDESASSGQSSLYGGQGDDLILIEAFGDAPATAPLAHGGIGRDIFQIEFTPSTSAPLDTDGTVITRHTIAEIADYNRNQDEIYLYISPLPDGSMPSLSVTPTPLDPAGAPTGSMITISYLVPHTTSDGTTIHLQLESQIWVKGQHTLDARDIRLVARSA